MKKVKELATESEAKAQARFALAMAAKPEITWNEGVDAEDEDNRDKKSIFCRRPITVGEAISFLKRLPEGMPMFVLDDYDTPPLNLNCLIVKKADDYEFEPEDGMDGKEFCAING
jgi:hypothetical protein